MGSAAGRHIPQLLRWACWRAMSWPVLASDRGQGFLRWREGCNEPQSPLASPGSQVWRHEPSPPLNRIQDALVGVPHPQDCRMTSSVGNSSKAAAEAMFRTAETAASAIAWIGCRATVRGGEQYSDSVVPS